MTTRHDPPHMAITGLMHDILQRCYPGQVPRVVILRALVAMARSQGHRIEGATVTPAVTRRRP